MNRYFGALILLAASLCWGCSASAEIAVPKQEFKSAAVRDLTLAALAGDDASVRRIAASGADLSEIGGSGISPLGWAIVNNSLPAVNSLLSAGANPNQILSSVVYETPLKLAIATKTSLPIMKVLLEAGADPNLKRPVELAAFTNNHDAFLLLVQFRAQLEWADRASESDLLVSSLLGDNERTFGYLLAHGYCSGYPWAALLLGVDRKRGALAASPDETHAINESKVEQTPGEAPDASSEALYHSMQTAALRAAPGCAKARDSRADRWERSN